MSSRKSTDGPPRRSSWWGTSWLMLTDIVGTSVLTYAGVAAQLGWVLTIGFIIFLSPVAIYTAVLMSRTRSILKASTGEEPFTMGEAARLTLGGDRSAAVVYGIVYGFGFLGEAAYLLTLGQSLQGIFFDLELCLPTAVLAACGICMPVILAVRQLSESVWLCLANLFIILAVLAIVMVRLAQHGRSEEVRTFLFAEDLTVSKVFGAATNVVFSYTGHWLYFELMSEMKAPEEFPRVFLINSPFQVALYLIVACWGYYFAGDRAEGNFLDNLEPGPSYRWASFLLFAHVAIAFLIKCVVLTRYFHGFIAPSRVNTRFREPGGGRARAEHAGCSVLLLVAGFLLANAVPFFQDFMGLIGGLFSGPISFILPMAFYFGARQKAMAAVPVASSRVLVSNPSLQPLEVEATGAPGGEHRLSPMPGDLTKLHWLDVLACTVVASFTVATMIAGTYGVVSDIAVHVGRYGPPFSCQAHARL